MKKAAEDAGVSPEVYMRTIDKINKGNKEG
jgi:hypothetical protein